MLQRSRSRCCAAASASRAHGVLRLARAAAGARLEDVGLCGCPAALRCAFGSTARRASSPRCASRTASDRRKRVARLDARARPARRRRARGGPRRRSATPNAPSAPDLLDRRLRASEPNRLCRCDLKYVPNGRGLLILAAVHDVFGDASSPRRCATSSRASSRSTRSAWPSPRAGPRCAVSSRTPTTARQYVSLVYGAYAQAVRLRPLDGLDRRPLGQRSPRPSSRFGCADSGVSGCSWEVVVRRGWRFACGVPGWLKALQNGTVSAHFGACAAG